MDHLPGGDETILVVEDEQDVRQLFRKILEQAGYAVVDASDGEHALEVAREIGHGFDLLLTDVVMPNMGGLELAVELQSERPDLKVLFVSGYGGSNMLDRGSLPPGKAFLPKPFTPEALLRKLRLVLGPAPA